MCTTMATQSIVSYLCTTMVSQYLHGTGSVWNRYEIGVDKATRDLVDPVWIRSFIWYQADQKTGGAL